jgi:hypothetical protein
MEKLYKDFDELVGDIKEHIKKDADAKIVENDDPIRAVIRYKDDSSNDTWSISCENLHKWLKVQDEYKADIIRRAFQTQDGKQALIDSFFKKKR